MTITEFLNARYDEEEAVAREELGRVTGSPRRNGKTIARRRVADIAAKRRIVSAFRSGFPDEDRYATGWHDFHVHALCLLAQAFADHPDYREEWKP